MSRRIAHRPRYQSSRSTPQTPPRSHKDFLHYHWMYRSSEYVVPETSFGTRDHAHSSGLSPLI